MGGIAMLTLSDTENNLHFILILQGLIKHQDRGEGKGQNQVELRGRQLLASGVERLSTPESSSPFSFPRASSAAHQSPAHVPPTRPARNQSQHHLPRE